MQRAGWRFYVTAFIGLNLMLGPWTVDGEQLLEGGVKVANVSSPHENNADQRHHKMLLLHKSDEVNRWPVENGVSADESPDKGATDDEHKAAPTVMSAPTKKEVDKGLEMLENLVHPEDELQDEEDDRQIFQAVVTSMAQWNLRKIQKLKEKKSNLGRHRSRRDDAVVCYNELGCFRDEGPFSYLDLLPSPPEEIGTRFYLYTPHNRDKPHELVYSNVSTILSSAYNATMPSKIMIHGFGSSCQRMWAKEMRTALISVGDVNVICVDWANGANLPNYVRAAVNTRLVGRQVALLVNAITGAMGSNNSDFHLIGFSLGAHVAGFAGSELRNLSRITGLDPAGPLFENYDPRARLDSSDADLVDVIHSNGEKIYMGGLGAWTPMGDIDFYPNGGRMQKGCSNLFVGAVSDMIWSSAEENGRSLCNHRRAYKLFTDSVVPGCHFPAFACESYEKLLEGDCFPCVDIGECSNMGYYADRSRGRGIMYLATREEEPFCANQYRVQLFSSPTLQPVTTQGKIELTLVGSNSFNETFSLTKGPDYLLASGGKLVRLIVPHPSFAPPTKVIISYTAYQGWIYSGLPKWPIDKILLTDGFGKSVSYCQKGSILESGKGFSVTLQQGECNPPPPPPPPSSNSLPSTSPVIVRAPSEAPPMPPMDNEIPLLTDIRFRSLDTNITAIVMPSNQTIESKSMMTSSRSMNGTTFATGNVNLALLQQQIPADIKVGGANGANSSKLPRFYQWPLVGNLFGSSRSRLRSLGGRKYEPHGQLTPPSLQQLQPAGSSSVKESSSRRPFFRRNNSQQSVTPDDQTKIEYYLLRQQQLHLQQQQLHQAARLNWNEANRSQPSLMPANSRNAQQLQYVPVTQYQQYIYQLGPNAFVPNSWAQPQRQVMPPPPPPPHWRPDALVDPEISRFPGASKLPELMPGSQEQVQSSLTVQPTNQQFARAQQNQQPTPAIRSSMSSSLSGDLTFTPTLSSSVIVAHTHVSPTSSSVPSSVVTLTTMTISKTVPVSQQVRHPEIELASPPKEDVLESSQTVKIPGDESNVTAELTTLPSIKLAPANETQSSNETVTATSPVNAANLNVTVVLLDQAETFGPNATASVVNSTQTPVPANKEDVFADEVFSSEGSPVLMMSDDAYPNPEELGQARDEYWSARAAVSGRSKSSYMSVPSAMYPQQYQGFRASRLQPQDQHQPLYIPLNPADRQSRQLPAPLYASHRPVLKKAFIDQPAAASA